MASASLVRWMRVARGLSSRQLGDAIGVSFQQVRRYETGADRMAAATLIRICVALRTSVAVVCEGLDRQGATKCAEPPASGTAQRLVADFSAIRQSAVRTNLCRLVASMAAASAEEPPSA